MILVGDVKPRKPMGLGSNPTSALFLYWYLERKRSFLLVKFKNMEISEARRRRVGILVYHNYCNVPFTNKHEKTKKKKHSQIWPYTKRQFRTYVVKKELNQYKKVITT